MLARRLIVALIALLVLSTLAAAFLPAPQGGPSGPTSTTSTRDRTGQGAMRGGRLVRASVDTTARQPGTIRLRVGDELQLRVISRAPDQVAVKGFGQVAAVNRFSPARFDLLATDAGRFAVRLVQARKTVARILVARHRRSNERPGRHASKG